MPRPLYIYFVHFMIFVYYLPLIEIVIVFKNLKNSQNVHIYLNKKINIPIQIKYLVSVKIC